MTETTNYLPKKLLVTGAAGFIGANFVHYWLEHYPDNTIVVLDALTYAGNIENLSLVKDHPQFYFIQGDICDTALVEKLLLEHDIETIVHFAAESHVDRSIDGPDAFIQTNVVGTHSLLKAAKKIWLDNEKTVKTSHRFHHVSTDEVYGSLTTTDPAFSEITPYAPNSPYSASKAASDHLVRAYHHTYGLKVTTSNCSNNYGPYHFPEKLIPLMIVNILYGKALPIYGDGLNIRDWLYVKDHAYGIDLAIQKGRLGETYNIGGNNEWKNIDIVKLLCQLIDEKFTKQAALLDQYPKTPMTQGLKSETLIAFVKDRLGHDRRYAIDYTKANKELGYSPKETFESGIRKTIDWYFDNAAWWQALLQKNR